LVCAGRIAPNKGQDVLLLAFKAVKEKHPDCRLYLVGGVLGGQKDYYNKLRRLAETLNLGDVVFTGYVSDEDLVRYYSLADIYVQPSVGEEGWGMGIVEAFACGKPVVCSDIFYRTGVADVDRALIVKGGDSRGLAKAIELLIEDEELRKRLAKNGYKFAQKLSWKRMADDVLQAINSLVSDKKKI
jgi:glycosyltransferase involved in cell wall biosynthesis